MYKLSTLNTYNNDSSIKTNIIHQNGQYIHLNVYRIHDGV